MERHIIRKGLAALVLIGGASAVMLDRQSGQSGQTKQDKPSIQQTILEKANQVKSGNFSVDVFGEHVVFKKK